MYCVKKYLESTFLSQIDVLLAINKNILIQMVRFKAGFQDRAVYRLHLDDGEHILRVIEQQDQEGRGA